MFSTIHYNRYFQRFIRTPPKHSFYFLNFLSLLKGIRGEWCFEWVLTLNVFSPFHLPLRQMLLACLLLACCLISGWLAVCLLVACWRQQKTCRLHNLIKDMTRQIYVQDLKIYWTFKEPLLYILTSICLGAMLPFQFHLRTFSCCLAC